mmetsp:Transcript_6165/g.7063  ORF Transcript_6165/g.7063 Transcript_6165/m.7063 type:complete len:572 (+) Transcript_6165:66-1781(+)
MAIMTRRSRRGKPDLPSDKAKKRRRRSEASGEASAEDKSGDSSSSEDEIDQELVVPVYRPSIMEFKQGLAAYVKNVVEKNGGPEIGLAKIIPPETWSWNAELELLEERVIDELETVVKPIKQHTSGGRGCFRLDLVESKPISAKKFKEIADSQRGKPEKEDWEKLDKIERAFWRSLSSSAQVPMYGADNVGSLFEDYTLDGWNLNKLDSLLVYGLEGKLLGGITSSMLYFGMWRSMFGWHTEDMELNSVNYLHHGAPKVWYTVPPAHADRLESLAKSQFGDEANNCKEFMRHKNIMISPSNLKSAGIPFVKVMQKQGEVMVTFPRSYHAGFNVGWNFAEAVNFATKRWIPYGRKARWCNCERYTVRFDMDRVVEKIRSQRPDFLSDFPEVGDRIMVHWPGWPGEYLVRLNKKLKHGKFAAVAASGGTSAFGEWEFNPKRDQWRWPREDETQPKVGDIICVRYGDWGKSEKEHIVKVVEPQDKEIDFAVVAVANEKQIKKGEQPFDPYKDSWRWPAKKELTSVKKLLENQETIVTPAKKKTKSQSVKRKFAPKKNDTPKQDAGKRKFVKKVK